MALLQYDKWRSAIIHTSLENIITNNDIGATNITLLPDDGAYHFLADPFGIWKDNSLYLFVESYDYRDRKGVIDVLIYNQSYVLKERRRVLEEPWHLSYPYIFEWEGDYYLLPEGYKSGKLSLYRAKIFPFEWEKVKNFHFPEAAIDATPLFFKNKWWIFWTPSQKKEDRQSALHLAVSENLTGKWRQIGCIHRDKSGARAGGTPKIIGDDIYLPVQDCHLTYGGGIRFLKISLEDEENIMVSSRKEALNIPSSLYEFYPDGLHTVSSIGEFTLIDVKKRARGVRHQFFHFMKRFK